MLVLDDTIVNVALPGMPPACGNVSLLCQAQQARERLFPGGDGTLIQAVRCAR